VIRPVGLGVAAVVVLSEKYVSVQRPLLCDRTISFWCSDRCCVIRQVSLAAAAVFLVAFFIAQFYINKNIDQF
jgi:hypothetical protein